MFAFGNRRILFAVLLLGALLLRGGQLRADELTPADGAALLAKLQALRVKYPSMQADFTEEKTSHLLNRPIATEGTVSFEVPDKFRREVKGNSPSLTVSNGKTLWIYYPAFKTAELYTLGQRAFFDDSISALTAGLNFQHIDEYYNVRAFTGDNGGYRFELIPKRPSLRHVLQTLTVWMDADLKAQKTEVILPKGDSVVTNYRNARRMPLPASTFEFAPGPDVQVSRPLGK
jgi:outer membrane lipoprotein-sorting protein